MVACENGHLDDFPWETYVHRGEACDKPLLRLIEFGPSGEARDLEVRCETCGKKRRLSQAFGRENRNMMPLCRGRRPHLRDFDPTECELHMRPIILGASNTWFSVIQNIIAIPVGNNKIEQVSKLVKITHQQSSKIVFSCVAGFHCLISLCNYYEQGTGIECGQEISPPKSTDSYSDECVFFCHLKTHFILYSLGEDDFGS